MPFSITSPVYVMLLIFNCTTQVNDLQAAEQCEDKSELEDTVASFIDSGCAIFIVA